MRNLYLVKQDHVLKLGGIAYYCAFTHNGFSADKCTVTNFSILIDDTGPVDIRGWIYIGTLGDPNVFLYFFEFIFGKSFSQFQNIFSIPASASQG